jgi:hypothetical protein
MHTESSLRSPFTEPNTSNMVSFCSASVHFNPNPQPPHAQRRLYLLLWRLKTPPATCTNNKHSNYTLSHTLVFASTPLPQPSSSSLSSLLDCAVLSVSAFSHNFCLARERGAQTHELSPSSLSLYPSCCYSLSRPLCILLHKVQYTTLDYGSQLF